MAEGTSVNSASRSNATQQFTKRKTENIDNCKIIKAVFGPKYVERLLSSSEEIHPSVVKFIHTCLVMILSSSRSPEFMSLKSRIKTLKNDGNFHKNSAAQIAALGFYLCSDKKSSGSKIFKCFFCGVHLPTTTQADDIDSAHYRLAIKCFVCKVHRAIFNTSSLNATLMDDLKRSRKAWTTLKPYLRDRNLVDFTASFGFSITIVRIAIVRYFTFSNGKFPRSGDVIDLIYRDLEDYQLFLQEDGLLEFVDPLVLIEDFLTADLSSLQVFTKSFTFSSAANEGRNEEAALEDVTTDSALREVGYCVHTSAEKVGTSKALVMVPCLHLIRCSICLQSESLKTDLTCPRCSQQVLGALVCYIT